ncbi:MAG: 23S rRNA (guanosine(2251)-2'-O)-methyltransferase RlmB [Candidatus Omnitrophica bacterium]|nr:23S rRNA (guanosine(2251)-2'-O)-methyltransferase RlmB [Candidatus Omnitrophota bacterium]
MSGSRDTMFLYGRNSVYERLKANPKSIRTVFLQDNVELGHIEKLIRKNHISMVRVSPRQLSKMKHAKDLQGVVAKVDSFSYAEFNDLLDLPKGKQPTLIFLDRLNDPQNLGVILRTAACFGGFVIVIPKFNACEVTEAVLHVASGGENFMPVSMVSNISSAILKAKEKGYWIMGGVIGDDAQDINSISIPFPLGLILGSEGGGIRYGIDKQLDIKARIPMEGANLSFNVAISCAIFCHEIAKQRK